jgi:hypothetical protein
MSYKWAAGVSFKAKIKNNNREGESEGKRRGCDRDLGIDV